MKNRISLLLCAALATALLAGCGGSASSSAPAASQPAASQPAGSQPTASEPASEAASAPAAGETADTARLESIVAAIEAVNEIPNPRAYTDLEFDIGMDLGVTTDNVVAFKGDVTNNGDDCAMVLALQVKDGTAESVMQELQAKKDEYSSNLYAEFADKVAKSQDARILNDGNIVLFVIAGVNGPDYSAIDDAINSALAQ